MMNRTQLAAMWMKRKGTYGTQGTYGYQGQVLVGTPIPGRETMRGPLLVDTSWARCDRCGEIIDIPNSRFCSRCRKAMNQLGLTFRP